MLDLYCISMFFYVFQDAVYLPGDPLEEDQELEFDKSAYEMYHEVCFSCFLLAYCQWFLIGSWLHFLVDFLSFHCLFVIELLRKTWHVTLWNHVFWHTYCIFSVYIQTQEESEKTGQFSAFNKHLIYFFYPGAQPLRFFDYLNIFGASGGL